MKAQSADRHRPADHLALEISDCLEESLTRLWLLEEMLGIGPFLPLGNSGNEPSEVLLRQGWARLGPSQK